MNRLSSLFIIALLTFTASWAGVVVYSNTHLARLQSVPDEETGDVLPPTMSGSAVAGQKVYASSGCVYCHTQQVRPAEISTDIEKISADIKSKLKSEDDFHIRRTVARDYMRDQPAFLGTMRIGPDLSNIALTITDINLLNRHLYEPASVVEGSNMPSFRFLYKMQKISGQASDQALKDLTGPHAPEPGYEVIPTQQSKDLIAYLLSLKRNYPLPEAPAQPAN